MFISRYDFKYYPLSISPAELIYAVFLVAYFVDIRHIISLNYILFVEVASTLITYRESTLLLALLALLALLLIKLLLIITVHFCTTSFLLHIFYFFLLLFPFDCLLYPGMQIANEFNCGNCNKLIPIRMRIIKCQIFFHVKCCGINHKTFNSIKQLNNDWNCDKCVKLIPNSDKILTCKHVTGCKLTISNTISNTNSKRKGKCGKCLKIMRDDVKCIGCDVCTKYFHLKCSGSSKNNFLRIKNFNEKWNCSKCLFNILPFSKLDNNDLYLEIQNSLLLDSDLINRTPSFSIQSLLHKMPGQNVEINSIHSIRIFGK